MKAKKQKIEVRVCSECERIILNESAWDEVIESFIRAVDKKDKEIRRLKRKCQKF